MQLAADRAHGEHVDAGSDTKLAPGKPLEGDSNNAAHHAQSPHDAEQDALKPVGDELGAEAAEKQATRTLLSQDILCVCVCAQ